MSASKKSINPALPIRTCIGCRNRHPKHQLVRLVVVDGRLCRDERQNLPGRGAYLCRNASCWQKCRNGGRLLHAFRLSALNALEIDWQGLAEWFEKADNARDESESK
ncbi:YlxR family protein [candidate division KSB1 bacterium]|nr:YlxR family protein [candidate division KSB1 bacterium]